MTKQNNNNQKEKKKLRLKPVGQKTGKRVIVSQPFPDEVLPLKAAVAENAQSAAVGTVSAETSAVIEAAAPKTTVTPPDESVLAEGVAVVEEAAVAAEPAGETVAETEPVSAEDAPVIAAEPSVEPIAEGEPAVTEEASVITAEPVVEAVAEEEPSVTEAVSAVTAESVEELVNEPEPAPAEAVSAITAVPVQETLSAESKIVSLREKLAAAAVAPVKGTSAVAFTSSVKEASASAVSAPVEEPTVVAVAAPVLLSAVAAAAASGKEPPAAAKAASAEGTNAVITLASEEKPSDDGKEAPGSSPSAQDNESEGSFLPPEEKQIVKEHLFPDEGKGAGGNPVAEKLGALLSMNLFDKLTLGKKQKNQEESTVLADKALSSVSGAENPSEKSRLAGKLNSVLSLSLFDNLSFGGKGKKKPDDSETAETEMATDRSVQQPLDGENGAETLPHSKRSKGSFGLVGLGKSVGAKKKRSAKGKKTASAKQEPEVVYSPGGRPTSSQLEAELAREKKRARYNKTLRSTIGSLVVVAAFAVLVATVFLPVLRIYGSSMSPTVNEGEIVFSLKGADFQRTDILAVYYGNKLLVKRCIAGPGQWVDIDEEGNVWVDNEQLDEPYLIEKAYGDCTITLPYQVPEGRYFVMGDNRSISQDSRNATVGCIAEEQIVGKIVFRIWPLNNIGKV